MDLGLDSRRNVGGLDRTLRAVLAVVGFGLAAWALVAGHAVLAAAGLLAGAGLAFNAITGFCLANRLLGIDTCSDGTETGE